MRAQFVYWRHAEFSLIELPVEKILSLRRIYFNGVRTTQLCLGHQTHTYPGRHICKYKQEIDVARRQ